MCIFYIFFLRSRNTAKNPIYMILQFLCTCNIINFSTKKCIAAITCVLFNLSFTFWLSLNFKGTCSSCREKRFIKYTNVYNVLADYKVLFVFVHGRESFNAQINKLYAFNVCHVTFSWKSDVTKNFV